MLRPNDPFHRENIITFLTSNITILTAVRDKTNKNDNQLIDADNQDLSFK